MEKKVVDDPVGVVVGLVLAVEPAMDAVALRDVVIAVAGGRAKQRRLAQTLLGDASVLRTGLSPAPLVVGELLIALHRVGAVVVAAPRCAECVKALRSLRRRGEHWYCGRCGPAAPQACQACGRIAWDTAVDASGRRVCRECRPSVGESVQTLVKLITAAEPGLGSDVITSAVHAAASGQAWLDRLARAVSDRPDLLTGSGAHAPVPSVLRLIDQLCDAGATAIVRPACPHCQRMVVLVRPRGGVWLCRNCLAKSRAVPCAQCGANREPATRDGLGRPLCAYCLTNDPANQEECVRCGRRRQVAVRGADGPVCGACRPTTMRVCAICGRSAPCVISRATGQPWCHACKQHWDKCAGCDQVRPVRSGTREQPLCATCTRPDPDFWRPCPTCGIRDQLWGGPCVRCLLDRRLSSLLGGPTGEVRPYFQLLHQSLLDHDRPRSVLGWLDRTAAADLLRRLGSGSHPPTHDSLDEFPDRPTVRQLRSVLVATTVLPPRDERMTATEGWVRSTIAGRTDPQQQQLLHRYVVWHLLRRLRRRTAQTDTTPGQAAGIRQRLRAAIVLLDWLTGNGLTLRTCRQADLDAWLAGGTASHHHEVGVFVRWATSQRLSTLEIPAFAWPGPSGTFDTERRWTQARRLIHDDTVQPERRLAGLLVLLYAQFPATISRLRTDHVDIAEDHVLLHLGREPVVLPEPLATLVRGLLTARRAERTAIGDLKASPWLFPGGRAGQPISSAHLSQRLRDIGIQPRPDRETALFHLAAEVPAAVLSRLLGVHISVATAWQRASAGDWTRYAAELGQRRRAGRNVQTAQGGPS